MPELITLEGITYRKVSVRYQAMRLDALVNDDEYKELYAEKKVKKTSTAGCKSSLGKQLDDLWSKQVKELAGYKCEKCGKEETTLNSHHIFSRKHKATRWNLENGISLCVTCHVFGNESAHLDPLDFMRWLKEYKGESFIDRLEWKSKTPANYSVGEMEMMLRQMQN